MRILIIVEPEEAEIFKDYLLSLARVSVRLALFSYDFKKKNSDVKFAIYFNQNKIGKVNICV